tara:strand:- start:54 stop:383 length:330 start_codon:yes stop_codon:yes gene_type:complete
MVAMEYTCSPAEKRHQTSLRVIRLLTYDLPHGTITEMGLETEGEGLALYVRSEGLVRHFHAISMRSIGVFRSLAEMHGVTWRVIDLNALVPVPPEEAVPEPCFETGLGA